jgi:transposase-like protein
MAHRRTFTPEFKAEVVLEWLSGAQSNTELSREHQMASSVLAEWKRPSGCSSHAWPFRLSEKRPKTVQLYGVITDSRVHLHALPHWEAGFPRGEWRVSTSCYPRSPSCIKPALLCTTRIP